MIFKVIGKATSRPASSSATATSAHPEGGEAWDGVEDEAAVRDYFLHTSSQVINMPPRHCQYDCRIFLNVVAVLRWVKH